MSPQEGSLGIPMHKCYSLPAWWSVTKNTPYAIGWFRLFMLMCSEFHSISHFLITSTHKTNEILIFLFVSIDFTLFNLNQKHLTIEHKIAHNIYAQIMVLKWLHKKYCYPRSWFCCHSVFLSLFCDTDGQLHLWLKLSNIHKCPSVKNQLWHERATKFSMTIITTNEKETQLLWISEIS